MFVKKQLTTNTCLWYYNKQVFVIGGENMGRLIIPLEDDLHKAAKIEAIMQDKSLIEYVTELIQKDLKTKKEQTR